MCGVGGIAVKPSLEAVKAMTLAMSHRGPDDDGYYEDADIALGICRLAIIDLETGAQPIFNEDKSIIAIFNGEIYNYKSLRNQLSDAGHRFYTNSDTEVLVHAYEQYGFDFLERLKGMFALAIWDKPNKTLLLARDRLGIKPLYYYHKGDTFIFASEIGALVASGLIPKELDAQALFHYISFPAIPSPFTMYKGIKALEPAKMLILKTDDINNLCMKSYWSLKATNQPTMSEDEAVERLMALLELATMEHLVSDVPLGAFLSGGIDSTALVALMSHHSSQPMKTFSVDFSIDDLDANDFGEKRYAEIAARHYGSDHTQVTLTWRDVLNELPRIVRYMDFPTGDGLNEYFVSRLAASKVKVALSGTGGDELFAGYPWFAEMIRRREMADRISKAPIWLRKMLLFGLRCIKGHDYASTWRSFLVSSDFSQAYHDLRRVMGARKIRDLFAPSWYHEMAFGGIAQDIKTHLLTVKNDEDKPGDKDDLKEPCLDDIQQVSQMMLEYELPDLLLRDTDSMSMACSLEVRVPLLDHQLVEFAFNLPASLKLRGSADLKQPPLTKYILRKALRGLVPEEILTRSKRGFIFPLKIWLKGPLRGLIDGVLSKESVTRRGMFNYPEIEVLKKKFLAGKDDYFMLWNLIILELWLRIHLDGQAADAESLGII